MFWIDFFFFFVKQGGEEGPTANSHRAGPGSLAPGLLGALSKSSVRRTACAFMSGNQDRWQREDKWSHASWSQRQPRRGRQRCEKWKKMAGHLTIKMSGEKVRALLQVEKRTTPNPGGGKEMR